MVAGIADPGWSETSAAVPALGRDHRSRLQLFHRRTGAEQVAVAVEAVDARDGRPELVLARPRRGIGSLFAGIGPVPLVGNHLLRGMRRILDRIIFLIHI